MLTFCENALLRRGDKYLGDGVEGKQHQRLKRGQSIAEVHQGGDEDEKVQHEGADIAERHCGGRRKWLRLRGRDLSRSCYLEAVVILGRLDGSSQQRHRPASGVLGKILKWDG
jgi:hypothetical protein